ncbi:MAG: hypothetical protein ACO1N8_13755 [Methylophilus sp.]
MADPDWLGYTGVITGVIGAITGIAGSVLGYIAYRRSDQLKALDLRLELRKNSTSLVAEANELLPLLEHAKKSKTAVASATGMYNSGATERWMTEYDSDIAKVKALLNKLPNPEDQHLDLSPTALETKLVEVHSLKETVSRFRKNYDDSIATDDKDRVQIIAVRSS